MSQSEKAPLAIKGAWSPFMCPSCRGIFRAQSGREGLLACPICDSEIAVSLESQAPSETSKEESNKIVKRRRKGPPRKKWKGESWEQTKEKRKKQTSNGSLTLISLLILSTLIAIGGFFLIKQRKNQGQHSSKSISFDSLRSENKAENQGQRNEYAASNSAAESEEELIQLGPLEIEAAKKIALKFLACESVEELAPLIRDSKEVMPLARKFYEKEPYQPIGALEVAKQGAVQVSKRFTSFEVVLKDYSSRLIAVELTDDGPQVDWKSWVAYCEVPWESFILEQFKRPKEVRVKVDRASYYNFDFRDDSEWACFRLSRSTDETVIFGYVARDAPFLKEMPKLNKPGEALRLKISYPDYPVAANQVIIDELIGSGWVDGL